MPSALSTGRGVECDIATECKGGGTLSGHRPRFAIEPLVGSASLAYGRRQLAADGRLHRPHLCERGVGASCGLAVEDGLAVVVHFKSAVACGSQGDCKLVAELAEELGRYPSGLWQVASGNAVDDLQPAGVCVHGVTS